MNKTYVKVTLDDGVWYICEHKDITDITEGSSMYTTEEVQMTEEEFEALPEFQG